MDRIVDHLFVFEGNGVVKDFRGTYSEYKNKPALPAIDKKQINQTKITKEMHDAEEITDVPEKKKLSYMENRELDQLGKDIEKLEKRKEAINLIFQDTNTPFDEIKKLSIEMADIVKQLENKEYRWFELIERA